MKKLTLVSFSYHGMLVSAFVMANIFNGKPVVSTSLVDHLFYSQYGISIPIGSTYTIG